MHSVCLSSDGRHALSGSADNTLKLWEVGTGRCLRTFEGHAGLVHSVCLTMDSRYALSGSEDQTLQVYRLDWELEENSLADWDEAARPYLEVFLAQQTPYAASLPKERAPSEDEIVHALTRRGTPPWTEDEFGQRLCRLLLGCGGYGWLRTEGVRRELEDMTARWQGPFDLRSAPSRSARVSDPVELTDRRPPLRAVGGLSEAMEVHGIQFKLIPAGRFLMGSPDSDTDASSDEKPQHRVHITRSFYLGVYPVTQSQYESLLGSNPSNFKGDGNRPVEQVSWEDANIFCRKLSEGLRGDAGGLVCRLPTEAEWEYACRAGTSTRYCFGDDATGLDEYAWFSGNSGRTTHPVGQKKPNVWGLYDMHGNVREWCQDGWDAAYYAGCPIEDPGGVTQASRRVNRGGRWDFYAGRCRSAIRFGGNLVYRNRDLGFRVALVPSGK